MDFNRGRLDRAARSYRAALRRNPGYVHVEAGRARVDAAAGIYADDALAWGLYRAGRCQAARSHSVAALRLGIRDGLIVFHRAMIERCLGAPSARGWFRQALAINPHFSLLWAPVGRQAVAGQLPEPVTPSA